MPRMSVATIDNPEFINLQPLEINPGLASCEIKVLYLGQNRNKTFINKETAIKMAKTLRGAPIVGWFREEKDDFTDHGDRVIIDEDGIKFEKMTRPYGFVAPDAKVWFQKFEDTNEFEQTVTREYLMTTGYLWVGQYEEAKRVIEEGRPESMELDDESLDGAWAEDLKSGVEFFIINDAIFENLCILGASVEPCFEGSDITAPKISSSFTLVDDTFKNTLYTMMQDLRIALEGGQKMAGITENKAQLEEPIVDNPEVAAPAEFTKDPEPESELPKDGNQDKEEYSLLQTKYSELETKYSDLETKYQELVKFQNQIENEKKDELIAKFYMLSEEDKKDVIENKAKYSLDEIEAKLSIIYCRTNKDKFNLDNSDKNDNNVEEGQNKEPSVTYNLDNSEGAVPAWIAAVRNTKKNRE